MDKGHVELGLTGGEGFPVDKGAVSVNFAKKHCVNVVYTAQSGIRLVWDGFTGLAIVEPVG